MQANEYSTESATLSCAAPQSCIDRSVTSANAVVCNKNGVTAPRAGGHPTFTARTSCGLPMGHESSCRCRNRKKGKGMGTHEHPIQQSFFLATTKKNKKKQKRKRTATTATTDMQKGLSTPACTILTSKKRSPRR